MTLIAGDFNIGAKYRERDPAFAFVGLEKLKHEEPEMYAKYLETKPTFEVMLEILSGN